MVMVNMSGLEDYGGSSIVGKFYDSSAPRNRGVGDDERGEGDEGN